MPAPPTNPGQGSKFGAAGPWIVIAIVATLAGLVLPQMMPGETVVSKSAAKTDSKDKSNLEYTAPPLPEPPNFQAMMVRLGAGTIIVLGLCVATLWGMRRWMNPLTIAGSGERAMRLMETLQLGNRCSLHLVRLGKRELIVGVDGTGIKTVQPLAEPFDEVLAQAEIAPIAKETPKPQQFAA